MRLNYGVVVMLNERVNNYITLSLRNQVVCSLIEEFLNRSIFRIYEMVFFTYRTL